MLKKLLDPGILKNDSDYDTKEIETTSRKDIAIIGISAKLPLADDIRKFWENTLEGVDSVRELAGTRKKDSDSYLKYTGLWGNPTQYSKAAYLDEIDKFDHNFFNLSPREAKLMDPNQRMFLETVWNAIEDAGYGGEKLAGSRTGVYMGFRADDFYDYKNCILGVEPEAATSAFTGNMTSIIASRISYLLDLKGPSLAVDTACSASLVAVHLACQAIRNRECEVAVAGSIRLNILPIAVKDKLGIESSDGKARTFDEDADGTGIGEGVMAIVLKPLNKALRDGDSVYAVIKGSCMNQDGSSAGITAPNVLAQEELLVRSWEDAGIDPETITYIETHGTGTKLGDPIEIDAIQRAFRRYTNKKQFCAVCSVKTNIGHLDNAAGIAGLIQAVLALKYKTIPPNFHFNKPNRKIGFEDSSVYVSDKAVQWQTDGFPRRCGVSSFGFSGTNCHVILEEADKYSEPTGATGDALNILALSAKNPQTLKELVRKYDEFLSQNHSFDPADMCFTANTGRGHYTHRLAVVFKNMEDLKGKLSKLCTTDFELLEENDLFFGQHRILSGNKQANAKNEISERDAREMGEEAGAAIDGFNLSGRQDGSLLRPICELYVKGAKVDWDKMYKGQTRKRVNLPVYPFEKSRCWLDIPEVLCTGDTYYTAAWQKKNFENTGRTAEKGTLLILKDGKGIGNEVEETLHRDGYEIISVSKGQGYEKTGPNRYTLSGSYADYSRLIGDIKGKPLKKIIHMFSVEQTAESGCSGNPEVMQANGVVGLLNLVRALAENSVDRAMDIVLVSQYAEDVVKEQAHVCPDNAMLFGLGKTLGWECPNLHFRCIDIDDATSAGNIIAELTCDVKDYKIAYRQGERYIEVINKLNISELEEKQISIKEKGVYMITGGTGGIGLEMAKYLASRGRANIALINRSRLPDRSEWNTVAANPGHKANQAVRTILEIEKSGAVIIPCSADVTNEDEIKAVIDRLRKEYGNINGIIHGAGIADGNLARNETEASFHQVLLPKVKGAYNLDRFTMQDEMDFFILFSSVITLIGKVGGGSYTSANTFLDSFAAYRNKSGRKTMTVGWPTWRDVGMLADKEINEDKEIFKLISAQDAVNAFDGILNHNVSRVIIGVLNGDGSVFELADHLPFQLSGELKTQVEESRKDLNTGVKLKAKKQAKDVKLKGKDDDEYTETERAIASIWRDILGFEEFYLDDNFREIGGDSVMITKVHSMIEEIYPGKTTVTDLFIYPTIASISRYIDSDGEDMFVMGEEPESIDSVDIESLLEKVEKGELTADEVNRMVSQWRSNDE